MINKLVLETILIFFSDNKPGHTSSCSFHWRWLWCRGKGKVTSFCLVSTTRDRTSWTHPPCPPPLQSSYGGNTGRGLRIIGNFSPLKAIIQNKTFQIYSSVELSCLFEACALVLETSYHVYALTFSLSFASLLSAFIQFIVHSSVSYWYSQLCVFVHIRRLNGWG